MIETIEVPLGSTKIRAFADTEMVLYCTKIDSEDKLKLNAKAWNHVNAFVENRKNEGITSAEISSFITSGGKIVNY